MFWSPSPKPEGFAETPHSSEEGGEIVISTKRGVSSFVFSRGAIIVMLVKVLFPIWPRQSPTVSQKMKWVGSFEFLRYSKLQNY